MHRQKHSEPSSVPLLEASLEHWIYLFVVHAVCVWHECRLKIISTINLGLIWRISSYHRPSSCRYFLIPPLTEISRRLKVKKKKFPTEKIPAKYNIYIYIYLTWRKFCFEFRFAIEFPLSRFFSSFPANWISENCLFQSIEFSHVTIQDERDEGEDEAWRYADSTKFETIFIFPPPVYLNVHLFVVDFVIRSAHRDNNWIHLKKLSRAEEKEERSVKRRGV